VVIDRAVVILVTRLQQVPNPHLTKHLEFMDLDTAYGVYVHTSFRPTGSPDARGSC
jgi:hypothetical protein